ncbi:hypothetical protein [Actinoplanes couchii]|uniref:Uncharacterized protein n=1 Tax=Actinoplanes couchii TaxID=403638 RepID=A0ABQ3XL34_9ACTN|nr:hypothetical protein [Actinoplanes couchii]MDR6318431.1 CheY-specific phosphatase CheX [Actinoplanes couchii]GID59203.1 hypothetical protein Aco03nite_076070 [Actinoplanes couchii]
MDHDDIMDAELDQLLARATVSALTTLTAGNDVRQLLRDLHADPTPPPTSDCGEVVP